MTDRDEAAQMLESARIQWRRDWDAMALGFVLGALTVLAVIGMIYGLE